MRVTAGRLRGRSLAAPAGLATRPTAARVREALFAILGPDLPGARVADLFAGTGALGIEALSRDAAHVTFFESQRPALLALRQNIEVLDLKEQTTVVSAPLPRGLGPGPAFDLVFIDPPWRADHELGVLQRLIETARVRPSTLLVLERAREHKFTPKSLESIGFSVEGERIYGDTILSFLTPSGAIAPLETS